MRVWWYAFLLRIRKFLVLLQSWNNLKMNTTSYFDISWTQSSVMWLNYIKERCYTHAWPCAWRQCAQLSIVPNPHPNRCPNPNFSPYKLLAVCIDASWYDFSYRTSRKLNSAEWNCHGNVTSNSLYQVQCMKVHNLPKKCLLDISFTR